MNTYNLIVHQQDVGFLLEAIDLRARFLKDMIQHEIQATEEERARKRDAERRAAMPDPFEQDKPIIVPTPTLQEAVKFKNSQLNQEATERQPTRKQKRAMLLRLVKKNSDLSIAEIARRAGVAYATAHKAYKAFAPKKGRK